MNTPFDPDPKPPRRGMLARVRASFLTGLVVIAPVGLTMSKIISASFLRPMQPDDRGVSDSDGPLNVKIGRVRNLQTQFSCKLGTR